MSDLRAQQAEKLWSSLRQAFINAGDAIADIIQTRAWEPLGYDSFAEAWADRMRGVELAKEVRAHVVYQMFAEGLSDDEIADTVAGVGPASVAEFRCERSAGVPADLATGYVRSHYRKKARPAQTIRIEFQADEYDSLKAKAKAHNLDLRKYCANAIRDAFSTL